MCNFHAFRRFQSHSHFVGLAYDVMRRRKSNGNVHYHTKTSKWEKTKEMIDLLDPETLERAATSSRESGTVDDPKIWTLLSSLSRTSTNLPGSDGRRSHLFVELKSSVVHFGLPLIFLTLNPADHYSPLALLYAGVPLDPRKFDVPLYPLDGRVRKLLANPLAVNQYFHTTAQAIIEGPLKGGLLGLRQFLPISVSMPRQLSPPTVGASVDSPAELPVLPSAASLVRAHDSNQSCNPSTPQSRQVLPPLIMRSQRCSLSIRS
jgi:Helitron helicase-like domain at N-terminus